VTLPLGERVNWVDPFGTGYLEIVTTSVAFREKGAALAGAAMRFWTNEAVVRSEKARLRNTFVAVLNALQSS